MQKPKTRWRITEQASSAVDTLVKGLELSPLVAKLLVNRGIDTIDKARKFLYREEMEYYDPFRLDGMETAVKRIHDAIERGEKILVFGDYDADGISSTALLFSVLKTMEADVTYYLPNRFTEGYGLNEEAIREAKANGIRLVVTVDTGISAVEVAEVAKELAIDLIITDHHEAPPKLPDAFAIINPKKPGCSYPFKGLAGVGVAFKLAHALLGRIPEEWLDIVAIGTIADLVPLVDENRLLAIDGLRALQTSNRPGIIALKKKCGINGKEIHADHVGFAIGPRINASGRMDSPYPALELLLTDDEAEAERLASHIDEQNRHRQKIVNDLTEKAIAIVERQFPLEENAVLLIEGDGWNEGVIGIVASRLVERYYRPTIVFSVCRETNMAKGSARSIEGFDIFEALSKNSHLLPHFGGHPMAAGLSMRVDDIAELRRRLNEQARAVLTEEDFKPITNVDVVASIEEISVDVIKQLDLLAPFGVDNPPPKVLFRNVYLDEIRRIGKDDQHLKLSFLNEDASLEAIGFNLGYLYDELSPQANVSCVGSLTLNEWNGYVKPQLMIEDLGIFDWQLFDWRSLRKEYVAKEIEKLPEERRVVIAFRKETAASLGIDPDAVSFVENESQLSIGNRYVVLLDIPYEEKQLKALFLDREMPSRIYTVFYQENDMFFKTNPNREQFKWFYAFLLKRKRFDLRQFGHQLAAYKGWSKDTVHLMAKVFYELGFVTVENGHIAIVEKPEKKPLDESPTYRSLQEQVRLENQFLYSSYQQLKQWFSDILRSKEDELTVKGIVYDGL